MGGLLKLHIKYPFVNLYPAQSSHFDRLFALLSIELATCLFKDTSEILDLFGSLADAIFLIASTAWRTFLFTKALARNQRQSLLGRVLGTDLLR